MGAERLLDVTSAHIDGCLYHGRAGLDFARRLADGGARVVVPTTLNVSSLDLLHPELVRLDAGDGGRRPSAHGRLRRRWAAGRPGRARRTSCPSGPALGEHVAWAESNAIVFANSVLGARTGRYGDFIDICCAITGRAPAAGLHLDEERLARAVFRVDGCPRRRCSRDEAGVRGRSVTWSGAATGTAVPAITGLPARTTARTS